MHPPESVWPPRQREIAPWVKRLTEDVLGATPFKIGDVVLHPSGRRVMIASGAYWTQGGFSNHWTWREIAADGGLSSVSESGYGWRTAPRAVEGD